MVNGYSEISSAYRSQRQGENDHPASCQGSLQEINCLDVKCLYSYCRHPPQAYPPQDEHTFTYRIGYMGVKRSSCHRQHSECNYLIVITYF